MFQYKFINFKTCATVVQDFEREEGCTYARTGDIHMNYVAFASFCCDSNSSPKKDNCYKHTIQKKETQIPKIKKNTFHLVN